MDNTSVVEYMDVGSKYVCGRFSDRVALCLGALASGHSCAAAPFSQHPHATPSSKMAPGKKSVGRASCDAEHGCH